MKYPKVPDFAAMARELEAYCQLKHEYGARRSAAVLKRAERDLRRAIAQAKRLGEDQALAQREPNALAAIQKLRPRGPRRLWPRPDGANYKNRLRGALLARMAGNILGAPVEGWPIEQMRAWARYLGDAFPPTDYWSAARYPDRLRYGRSLCDAYTRSGMDGVPVDDDLAYTLLGLLICERSGPAFSTNDVADAWQRYLPYACTAEDVALRNLRAGVSPRRAAGKNNPYCQWIGADIRADPWGYMAPGWPQRAAEMAYRDSTLSHRRNGIYGAMFFAATIAAAFAVDDAIAAVRIGLTEIPRQCSLAQDVRWALRTGHRIKDYEQARRVVDRRFGSMHGAHTNNNACLTIFGLYIGGRDVSQVISQTVAMGLDNDCTAATAGSIAGAVGSSAAVPRRWHRRFHNTVHSYLIGKKSFKIDDLLDRFAKQAAIVHGS